MQELLQKKSYETRVGVGDGEIWSIYEWGYFEIQLNLHKWKICRRTHPYVRCRTAIPYGYTVRGPCVGGGMIGIRFCPIVYLLAQLQLVAENDQFEDRGPWLSWISKHPFA